MRRGRHLLCWAALACLAGTAAAEDDSNLALPRWTPDELNAMRANPEKPPALGGLLGPIDDPDAVPGWVHYWTGEDGDDEIIADTPDKTQPDTDLSRFLPPSLLKGPRSHPQRPDLQPSPPSPIVALTDVPSRFLHDCESQPPATRLIDPNHELSETSVEDFERFLSFHASDCSIPLNLVILGKTQKLPEGANIARFASGSIARGPAAVLICPYGEPWRARFFVSQGIRDAVPASYLNSLLENSIRDALRATDTDEQLHRMLVQLSVRLFWVQRMLKPASIAASPVAARAQYSTPLVELAPAGTSAAGRDAGLPGPYGLMSVLLLGLGIYILRRWHRFKMRHYEWLLPAPATPAVRRLGGQACGGCVTVQYR